MAKKSKKANLKLKPSLSSNNQTVATTQLVALKKANAQAQSEAVETRSDVGKETEQVDPPSLFEKAESASLDAATKPEHREQETVAKKELSPSTNSEVKTERENSLKVESAQKQLEKKPQDLEADKAEQTEQELPSTAFFQAIGIIKGEVDFPEDGKTTVTIGRQKYPLFYTSRHRFAYSGLKKEIEATGNKTQRLIVYPKVTHFPKRDTPHFFAFQLVGFDTGKEPEGINSELKDLEFKLCGLWQFIPVCRTPCVSIFKNFNKERLNYIKEAEPETKVRFMKASHLPLLWRDSPVRPFRFNPKGGKDQGHPAFVSVKARFMPGRDCFGFVEMLAEPEEKAPRFLKVSKKDKETAMKNQKSKVAK